VIDPDGGIDQDQPDLVRRAARARRRGGRRKPFSEPPRAASLRALSRAINASRPAWTIAVFSFRPVRLRALARRSSSRISVVLICISMPFGYALIQLAAQP
jgi:IS5 family transposase